MGDDSAIEAAIKAMDEVEDRDTNNNDSPLLDFFADSDFL